MNPGSGGRRAGHDPFAGKALTACLGAGGWTRLWPLGLSTILGYPVVTTVSHKDMHMVAGSAMVM